MTRPNLNAVALVPDDLADAIASTGFHVLRTAWISPKWLFYLVQSDAFVEAMSAIVQGVVYPAIRPKDINSYAIPVAPLSEQRRIVSEIEKHFTRLDAAVATLKRAQANLKRYRAAVLKAACEGSLVPTEADLARAAGREYEPADALLQRIVRERRMQWEYSQLRKMGGGGAEQQVARWKSNYREPPPPDPLRLPKLPQGWTWATVEQLSTHVQYGTSAKTGAYLGGVPVLRMGNIIDGRLSTASLKYLPASHGEFPELLLSPGDVLFNRTNSPELVGKTAVYRGTPYPCSFASYLIRVKLAGGYVPDLLAYYINSARGREWIKDVVVQQVGQANVNGTKLQALAVPLPPGPEQERIVSETERRLSVIEQLEAEIEVNLKRAQRLQQSILKRAFEGRLVPQNQNDEPASTLLARIKAEREVTSVSPNGSAQKPSRQKPVRQELPA